MYKMYVCNTKRRSCEIRPNAAERNFKNLSFYCYFILFHSALLLPLLFFLFILSFSLSCISSCRYYLTTTFAANNFRLEHNKLKLRHGNGQGERDRNGMQCYNTTLLRFIFSRFGLFSSLSLVIIIVALHACPSTHCTHCIFRGV